MIPFSSGLVLFSTQPDEFSLAVLGSERTHHYSVFSINTSTKRFFAGRGMGYYETFETMMGSNAQTIWRHTDNFEQISGMNRIEFGYFISHLTIRSEKFLFTVEYSNNRMGLVFRNKLGIVITSRVSLYSVAWEVCRDLRLHG